MASQTTKLSVLPRDAGSSRAARRLRRAGQVPGVLYGGGDEPLAFAVDARALRYALAARGAVVELELDGSTTPVVLKDAQRHPVRGEMLHVDFLRVRLDVAIAATVGLELVGAEDAPGVREGGVLEHVTREVTIEALPTDIPERLEADVSALEINDTLTLAAVTPPAGVKILDDVDETVVATLTPPTVEPEAEEEELEEETERVGEEGEAGEAGEAPAAESDASADE
ncbi:MAG TPA: 50S ribosomal protein L25 [Solirubrobacteraceae bacterium]|nr:50S ribosomal protein L25 [Solirubrobacteraceae bacterium]